jgi:hypothetical protein
VFHAWYFRPIHRKSDIQEIEQQGKTILPCLFCHPVLPTIPKKITNGSNNDAKQALQGE